MKFPTGWLLSIVFISGCASTGKGPSPFVLVEGRKIGTLEVVPEKDDAWTRKKRDSLAFDNQYLHTRPRIGFKYPGETITLMKVFEGGKLVKKCDEASYAKDGAPTDTGWTWQSGPKGAQYTYVDIREPQDFKVLYNIECHLPALKDGMTVELHDHDGLVSRYKVVVPEP